MKDEIKDILLKLQILKNTKEIDEYHIDKKDGVRLLNYITNLQEENEDLKDYLDIFKLSNKTKQETIDDFRKRIDKANEIIDEVLFVGVKNYRSQLEIIQKVINGSDK